MNTATAIIAYSATEAALIDLAAKYKNVIYDVTTIDGMTAAKAARNEIRAHRITLEKAREKEKAESLAYGRFVDSEAKRISERIAELEMPIAAMINAEENKAKIAEEAAKQAMIDKAAAEEKAKRDAEEARFAAERAAIAKRQAEIEAAERESRRKIEEEERTARLAREEADRQSRLAQQAREEVARVKAQQEEERLMAERRKLEVERRAIEEAQRKEREAEEARLKAIRDAKETEEREIQRKANELNDGYEMLATFVRRFGKLDEFKAVAQAIGPYLKRVK